MRLSLFICLAVISNVLWGQLPSLNTGSYTGEAKYEVWTINSDSPIVYDVSLVQQAAPADSLMPCKYLIVSSGAQKDCSDQSFSAYFDGNFYRFRNDKLVEWHFESNPAPFLSGVPKAEMFTSLLPAFIRETFDMMPVDSTYIYNVSHPGNDIEVKGSQNIKGYEIRRFTYRFDADGRPLFSEIISNPETNTEQVVSARYSYPQPMADPEISEARLEREFGTVFDNFKEGKFSLKSLIGRPLPSYALQTPRERFTYTRGKGFGSPILFVFLSDLNKDFIEKVQSATDGLDVFYVIADNNVEEIAEMSACLKPNEKIAYSAGSFARDCGVREFPSFVSCNSEGIIEKILIGANNDWENFVRNL